MPIWNIIYLQNRNSPLIEHLTYFHDHTILIIFVTSIITLYLLVKNFFNKNFNQFCTEFHETESFWTLTPALILIFIAIPSLKTLYLIEESLNPLISIKTLGYQWYWSYEYTSINKKNFSCLRTKSNKINLLTTSNSLIIPTSTPTQILISSKDVIHSWTVPALGIKRDAIPGRINQILINIKRPSIIIGQCSEICGSGHSFIPIYLESPSIKSFLKNF